MLRLIGISVLFIFGVLIKYGCGEPETEKYAPAPSATGTASATAGGTATAGTATAGTATGGTATAGTATSNTPVDCQSHFDTNIAPAVVTSCASSSCHAEGSSAPIFSVSGGGAAARTALKSAFSSKSITNDTTYTAVLGTSGSFSSHPGGAVASTSQLTPALVKAWLECEAG